MFRVFRGLLLLLLIVMMIFFLQICAVLVRQLGVGFLVFEPGIRKVYATAGDKYFSEVSMPAFHKYKVLLAELISQVTAFHLGTCWESDFAHG